VAERDQTDKRHEPPDPDDLIPSQRRRRQAIIEGALSLLEQSTYDKIQMRDVAQEGNVALGTVYRYFASKEHLFAAVLVQWTLVLEQRVQRGPLRGDSPAERLGDMMRRVLSSFERWPQFFAVVSLLETTTDTHAQAMNALFQSRANTTFRSALEGLSDDDKRAVIEINNAVLSAVMRQWTMGDITIDEARRRMERCIDMIFVGPSSLRVPA
jgi:AcrR family transcriptional regulator